MKVFDSQGEGLNKMPDDVKRAFFDYYKDSPFGNDCYVEWEVQWDDMDYEADDELSVKRRLIDNWLIDNGAVGRYANDGFKGEMVLIKHWW